MKFRAGDLEFNAERCRIGLVGLTPDGQHAANDDGTVPRTEGRRARVSRDGGAATTIRGLFSLDDTDQPEAEWRVRESTSSYVGTEPWGVNHHVWRIEQVERFACQALRVDSVELQPYDYTEEVLAEGGLRLAARALATEADLEAISRIVGPVEVTRFGISDTPRQMRLTGLRLG